MARGKIDPWHGVKGGFVRKGVYYFRRSVPGLGQREISTYRTTEAAALAELQKFELAPQSYEPAPAREELILDRELAKAFLLWSKDERKNTTDWVQRQQRELAWWAERLGNRDLRRVVLVDHILPHKAKAKGWAGKVRVLKAFYGWLRKEKHAITLAEDPVAGTLSVPAGRPQQWSTSKVIARADYNAVRDELAAGLYRDGLIVLAATGWHKTELRRFAEGGKVEPMPKGRRTEGAGILHCPRTKGGSPLKTVVSAAAFEAGTRLRAAGYLPVIYFQQKVDQAAVRVTEKRRKKDPKAAEVAINLGSFRHTVATWAIEAGASREQVAAFLNHRSWETTQKFYSTLAAPPKVPTIA